MIGAPREFGLDVLRVCGAMGVLLAHGGYFLFPLWPQYEVYALAGWLGTEIFFALSGFLVMRELLATPLRDVATAARYAAWRAWRILPLFWLFLVLHGSIAMADGRGLPETFWRYPLLLQNLAWPHPGFFGEAWNLPLLLLFSLAAPGIVLGAHQMGATRGMIALVLVALGFAAIGLRTVWVLEHAPVWDEGVRKLVVTRLDACVYGALAACLVPAIRRHAPGRSWAAIMACIATVWAIWLFLGTARDTSVAARVFTFVASGLAMALACVALHGDAATKFASHLVQRFPGTGKPSAAISALARAAYPLYLVNMPLLLGLALAGFGQISNVGTACFGFALWLLLSIALAFAMHYALERPWLAWGRRCIKPARANGAPSA
jgi:peptidoglycan/LPS O-acetylase OafA/YrhL